MTDLKEAAARLVEKLDYVHQHPAYMAVWQIAWMHLGQYQGPQYDAELAALRDVLERSDK